ncbi:hypothetical protein C7974DRAFT_405140 [Boeremia exigua]|uniref:uncharacterized protein n=1 Tax=Boeremia exigua TaxID=749465 RepID=UPI001E8DB8A1|nr:uncharacterized protein C7974DRAFT_405140 [Boeremia exigua]KAH6613084.1 hypothetical protein C7974DRAFT_405140 [Boeremia exigua]
MPQNASFVSQGDCKSDLLFIFVAFGAVALWSTVPLTIRVLTTLNTRSGMFFWSLMATTWGLCLRQIGFIAKSVPGKCPWPLAQAMLQIGWIAMVSGFSMVLYSRLSIICHNRNVRRAILFMIIFNGIVWHSSMTIISFGKVWTRNGKRHDLLRIWERVHNPFERCQIIFFTLQETMIACFYIHTAYKYLKNGFARKRQKRTAITLLLVVQLIIVAIDVAMITIDFLDLITLKVSVHSFSYAIKLELEFVVLTQLVELSKLGLANSPTGQRQSRDMEQGFDRPGSHVSQAQTIRISHSRCSKSGSWASLTASEQSSLKVIAVSKQFGVSNSSVP